MAKASQKRSEMYLFRRKTYANRGFFMMFIPFRIIERSKSFREFARVCAHASTHIGGKNPRFRRCRHDYRKNIQHGLCNRCNRRVCLRCFDDLTWLCFSCMPPKEANFLHVALMRSDGRYQAAFEMWIERVKRHRAKAPRSSGDKRR